MKWLLRPTIEIKPMKLDNFKWWKDKITEISKDKIPDNIRKDEKTHEIREDKIITDEIRKHDSQVNGLKLIPQTIKHI